jgi:hypothetical protein
MSISVAAKDKLVFISRSSQYQHHAGNIPLHEPPPAFTVLFYPDRKGANRIDKRRFFSGPHCEETG